MRSLGSVDVVVPAGALLGEGPRWDAATRTLLWVDLEAEELHLFDPATGEGRSHSLGLVVTTAPHGLAEEPAARQPHAAHVFVAAVGVGGPPARPFAVEAHGGEGSSTAPSEAEPTSAR